MLKKLLFLLLLLPATAKSQHAFYTGFHFSVVQMEMPAFNTLLDSINTHRDTGLSRVFRAPKTNWGFGFHSGKKIGMLWLAFGFTRSLHYTTAEGVLGEHDALPRTYQIRTTLFAPNIEIGFMPVKYFGICGSAGLGFQRFKIREDDAIVAKKLDFGTVPYLGGLAIFSFQFKESALAVQIRPFYKITLAGTAMDGVSSYFLGANNYTGTKKTTGTFIGAELSIGFWQGE